MTAEPAAPQHVARIVKVNLPLPPEKRCFLCGAQAWVEVEVKDAGDLYFCAHDYAAKEEKFLTAIRIIDHRDALYAMERGTR